jgi:beta-fructofuranosidase
MHPAPRSRGEELWPIYHLTALPHEGVVCPYDPNGAIWWNGRYHVFYIYQDRSLPHGGHCWGHWSSSDLVNWECHPPALVPGPDDPETGIFSANAFVSKEGAPMLCWCGIGAGVCVGTALDEDLIQWEKHPANPVIPIPREGDPGYGVYGVWDPHLWLEGDTYCCLLANNRLPDGKDTLYVATSDDLVHWDLRHPFYEHPDPRWTLNSEDCSCPDFFALGDKHVLMCISHNIGVRSYLGRFDRENWRFYPEQHVRMNWPGGTFFANESLLDPRGRRIFWGWVTDVRVAATRSATGSGTMSLPRVLELNAAGDGFRITPAEELQNLRRNRQVIEACEVASGETALPQCARRHLELQIELDPGNASAVGLKLYCSANGQEETVVWYDTARERLIVDTTFSTLRGDVSYGTGPLGIYSVASHETNKQTTNTVEAPLVLAGGETLRLNVFVDGPVLEVFANDRQCVTQQVYPALPDSAGVKLCARGGTAHLLRGEVWEMASAEFVDHKFP